MCDIIFVVKEECLTYKKWLNFSFPTEAVAHKCFIQKLFKNLGFYSNTSFYSRFSPKIEFLYRLLSLISSWGAPMVVTKGKICEIYVSRWKIAGKLISDTLSDCRSIACTSFVSSDSNLSWNFRVSWGVL